jgi:ATP-dependent helicase/DNAse subunit B
MKKIFNRIFSRFFTKSVENSEFDFKDEFQIKAGIKGDKKYSISDDPKSIEVIQKILVETPMTFVDDDPFNNIALSRLSKDAKEKISKIAKEDIKKQLETSNLEFSKLKNIKLTNPTK